MDETSPMNIELCPGCDNPMDLTGMFDEIRTDSSGERWHLDCLDDYRAGE